MELGLDKKKVELLLLDDKLQVDNDLISWDGTDVIDNRTGKQANIKDYNYPCEKCGENGTLAGKDEGGYVFLCDGCVAKELKSAYNK